MYQTEIRRALETLRNGGTLLYPTDTIWGLGCDATDENAVRKIFRIKRREESKSLITLVSDEKMLSRFVDEVPPIAWTLMELSEKPVTIIYEKVGGLARNVIAENGSAGIRLVNDKFCKALIREFQKPIVSTSANISGEPAPQNFKGIKNEILEQVDYVVNYRQNETVAGRASSVIRLKPNGEFHILRK